ncbi:MAG: energy transducer TonB [Bacteroidales bacterium]|jgi:protein TonB|nr:energy transducer TonB [Bacteroidales bacterium]
MRVKKYDKVNLEKYRTVFILFGLVLSLGIVALAFEWGTKDISKNAFGDLALADIAEEEINVTEQKELPPEVEIQEPEPESEQIIETLVVVDNDANVNDININTEANENTATQTHIVTQTTAVVVEEEYVEPINFAVVEEKPTFPGGEKALMQFVRDNVTYPPQAKEIGISGRVYIKFVVDKNGKMTQIGIASSVDPLLDNEAIRVVTKLSNEQMWSPGKQRGKAVPVNYMIPITFKLN